MPSGGTAPVSVEADQGAWDAQCSAARISVNPLTDRFHPATQRDLILAAVDHGWFGWFDVGECAAA